jgi:hypothetical protein
MTDDVPEYRIVTVVEHGQELADLVRFLSDGFYLVDVGEAAYTLRRDTTRAAPENASRTKLPSAGERRLPSARNK